jgi:hypothetical protein
MPTATPPPFASAAPRSLEREAERIRQDRIAETRSQIATLDMLRRMGRVQDVEKHDRAVENAREYLARNGGGL